MFEELDNCGRILGRDLKTILRSVTNEAIEGIRDRVERHVFTIADEIYADRRKGFLHFR